MSYEHQPGSPGVDLDELEREGHEWDHGQLLRATRSLGAELRTLRARVGELEVIRCHRCGSETGLDPSNEELRGVHVYCDACEIPIEADEHRHQLETFQAEVASLRTRAESAEARVKELEAELLGERCSKCGIIRVYHDDAGCERFTDAASRITDLESQLAAAREETRWRLVEERPAEEGFVLAWCEGESIRRIWFSRHLGFEGLGPANYEPTHWLPLPRLPAILEVEAKS